MTITYYDTINGLIPEESYELIVKAGDGLAELYCYGDGLTEKQRRIIAKALRMLVKIVDSNDDEGSVNL